jgi:hypothetical protein
MEEELKETGHKISLQWHDFIPRPVILQKKLSPGDLMRLFFLF